MPQHRSDETGLRLDVRRVGAAEFRELLGDVGADVGGWAHEPVVRLARVYPVSVLVDGPDGSDDHQVSGGDGATPEEAQRNALQLRWWLSAWSRCPQWIREELSGLAWEEVDPRNCSVQVMEAGDGKGAVNGFRPYGLPIPVAQPAA